MTFPVDYFDLPSSANFPYDYKGGGSMFTAGGKHSGEPNVGYTVYAEGSDVGYRYFSKPGAPEVSYPFGHGLSYTTFETEETVFLEDRVRVTVRNTGPVAGRHVVMVKDPVLRAFGKTGLLQPGRSETMELALYPAPEGR